MSDISALQLECRFSLITNSLGYCGRASAKTKLRKCILNGDCQGVCEEVKKFIPLYSYLTTIAEITGLSPFSYEVIESYWIGNDLLRKVKPEDYNLLLENFEKQGVPDFLIEELRQNKPKVFIPTHLFQVLHVGVGRATGSVPFNMDSINNCMIRWGEVEKINKNKINVNLNSLKKNGGNYKLISKQEPINFDKEITPNIKVHDIVAVHWKLPVKILNFEEEEQHRFWNKEILKSLS